MSHSAGAHYIAEGIEQGGFACLKLHLIVAYLYSFIEDHHFTGIHDLVFRGGAGGLFGNGFWIHIPDIVVQGAFALLFVCGSVI